MINIIEKSMPFEFPTEIRNGDGKYGPTEKKHYYISVGYHKRNAKKRKDKTRWIIPENGEYYTFKISDENLWFCKENNKLFSVINNGDEILGENGERIALFWPPANDDEPWHGFPIFSENFLPSSELLDKWQEKKIIPYHFRLKIEKRNL
jgi:hypothetical protein